MQSIEFYSKLNDTFNYNENEFNGLIADYSETIDLFAFLVNIMWEKKIKDEDWKYFSETLGIKYIIQASSLKEIFFGTKLELDKFSKSITVFDITSLYIISRSMLENYLTLFYLFIDNVEQE